MNTNIKKRELWLDFRAGEFSNSFLSLIIPICGLVFLVFISDKIISSYKIIKDIFKYIGKNTIYILLYHSLFFQIVSFIQIKFKGFSLEQISNSWNNIFTGGTWCFIALLFGICLPILTKYIIDLIKRKLHFQKV